MQKSFKERLTQIISNPKVEAALDSYALGATSSEAVITAVGEACFTLEIGECPRCVAEECGRHGKLDPNPGYHCHYFEPKPGPEPEQTGECRKCKHKLCDQRGLPDLGPEFHCAAFEPDPEQAQDDDKELISELLGSMENTSSAISDRDNRIAGLLCDIESDSRTIDVLRAEHERLTKDNESLREQVEQLTQIASGNEERTALLVKKHSRGTPPLTESEQARLAALQELAATVIPRVPPDMLQRLREPISKKRDVTAEHDQLRARVAELEAELRLRITECAQCGCDLIPSDEPPYCETCGRPDEEHEDEWISRVYALAAKGGQP